MGFGTPQAGLSLQKPDPFPAGPTVCFTIAGVIRITFYREILTLITGDENNGRQGRIRALTAIIAGGLPIF